MGLDMCMGKPGKDISISGLSNRKAGRAVVRTEDGEKEQLWDGEEEQSFGSGGAVQFETYICGHAEEMQVGIWICASGVWKEV